MKSLRFFAKSRTISLLVGLVILTLVLPGVVSAQTTSSSVINTDQAFYFGAKGDKNVVGDWNGDGITTPGVYRNGVFYLKNNNNAGNADLTFVFGQQGDIPVVGDWNGDGKDTIGVYRNGVFYLKNNNNAGNADLTFVFGQRGDIPCGRRLEWRW